MGKGTNKVVIVIFTIFVILGIYFFIGEGAMTTSTVGLNSLKGSLTPTKLAVSSLILTALIVGLLFLYVRIRSG